MAFNSTTAQAASGDISISITPFAANDLLLVGTSSVQTSSGTPSGWTHGTGSWYHRAAPDANPITFDIPAVDVAPNPQWAALMVDLQTIAVPAVESQTLIDFGLYPLPSYSHTLTLNNGDCIVWQFSSFNTGAPSFAINDTQGNEYTLLQNTQLINGKYVTSFFAIAVGCAAGSCTVTMQATTPQTTNQQFDTTLDVFSGVGVPSIKPLLVYAFQDPQGNPLANGSVSFRLTTDIGNGLQVAAGRKVTMPLDQNGSCVVALWANNALNPSDSKYHIVAYNAGGAPVWQNFTVIEAQPTPNYLLTEDGGLFLLESGTPFDGILLEN